MSEQKPTRQPQNIFEVINQNIVDLSQDVVELYRKVEMIYAALYPAQPLTSEPDGPGAETADK